VNANHIDIEDVRGKAFDVAGVFFLIMLALLIFVTFLLSSRIEDCKRRLESRPPVLSLKCSGCTAFKGEQWPDALQMTSELLADDAVGWVTLEKQRDGTIAVHSTAKHRFERRGSR